MKQNELILLSALGIGAFLIWYFQNNPSPGTFSPDAPGDMSALNIFPKTVSSAGISFIENQEGFAQMPTGDTGGGQVIGYGHTIQTGEDYSSGISQDNAANLLDSDLAAIEDAINNNVTVPISQNQFDAMADLAYNIGINAFLNSTLLSELNAGNYSGASAQFAQWVNAGGQFSQGLANRRAAEQANFNS